ncbi:hypothetical protein [Oricola indica]|jgi:hypothetical protein|uniref:hypothetical protein n=1 Tax=Oricola indica TaxID=2872591 RepID=UPI001CC1B51A|nr:hypothetical protein [Oricola indica]
MSVHRFAIGDIVCFRSVTGMGRNVPDQFEVVALLPPRDSVLQYRIRSADERHERIATEDDIMSVRDTKDRIAGNSNIPNAGRPS